MIMSKTDETFKQALIGRKIPILTLDHKWHQLFTQAEYSSEIKYMEEELVGLLKRQGKVNTKHREVKKLKKKLMDEVVILADEMGEHPTKKQDKDMADHKRLINECNEKMESYEEEMVELPRQINQLNNKLMLVTMDVCYKKLQENTAELEEIEQWIKEIRRELKKKVVRKQEKEAINHHLYAYMHDIFGADVIELFDMKYDPEQKYQKKTVEPDKEKDQNKEKEQAGQTEGETPKEENTDASKS